jgi:hypothetical protein
MRLTATFLIFTLSIFVAATGIGTVKSVAVIYLSPSTGRIGTSVSVSGTGFLPTDTTCTLSSTAITSAACLISSEGLTGGFTVANVPPGAYVVEGIGDQGDIAQALLTVNGAPQLGLSPATAQPGTQISIAARGFIPNDATCSISSTTPGVILAGTAACVIPSGTGTPTGGFTVGNAPPGEYVIMVTGNQGDSAEAILDVR